MGLAIPPPFERVNIPQMTINELEQSAAQELAKLRLGVVDQDLLVPFDQMQKHNVWQYKSDGGHPSLLPMGILRGATGEPEKGETWQAYYAALLGALPDDVQEKLAHENSLPPHERDPEYFALEMVTRWLGMSAAFLDKTENSGQKESVLNEAMLNSALPQFALDNALQLISEEAQETHSAIDPAHPDGEAIASDWQDLDDLAQGISSGISSGISRGIS